MTTTIRAEISERNQYWISKHRHYELKHFCLQYPSWKRSYLDFSGFGRLSSTVERLSSKGNTPTDRTATYAMMKAYYSERINLIEKTAKEADEYLYEYILKAVTEGLSYSYLKTKLEIPCGKDMYYDRYRKFFWLLSETRD